MFDTICSCSESSVTRSSHATIVIFILLRIENERLEFQVQNILWHVFFALSMPQEHLKQNKESDVYFTCTVVSCGKIPFNG